MSRIGRLAIATVCVVVVGMLFVVPLWVRWDFATLSPGDRVSVGYIHGAPIGYVPVVAVTADSVTVEAQDGSIVTVPKWAVSQR